MVQQSLVAWVQRHNHAKRRIKFKKEKDPAHHFSNFRHHLNLPLGSTQKQSSYGKSVYRGGSSLIMICVVEGSFEIILIPITYSQDTFTESLSF